MSDERDEAAASGLFEQTPRGARLLGSQCAGCGTAYFPRSAICHNPECEGSDMQDARFGPHGRLFSCAIQNYPPPAPALYDEPYEPYAVGIVDLPEGLRVLGRLLCDDPRAVEPGDEVELVIAPLMRTASGQRILSWQFRPEPKGSA